MKTKQKGNGGEREVANLWKSNGWPDIFRTPRSGGMRIGSMDNYPPFPLDLCSGWPAGYPGDRVPRYGPWIVEVKREERDLIRVGRGGLEGESFIRRVLRTQVIPTVEQVNRANVGSGMVWPVLFARANRMPWRVFVPVRVALDSWSDGLPALDGWLELVGGAHQFFDEIAERVT